MHDAVSSLSSDVILTVGVAVLFTLAFVVIGRLFYRRRIRRWARSKHLTLVDWRPAWFYEGPNPFFRTRYRHVFWIEVEDSNGTASTGWLTYSWWNFGGDPEVDWN